MDIREILRRVRTGQSDNAIHKDMGINRRTVAKYRHWAEEEGLLEGDLPDLGSLHQRLEKTMPEGPPPQNISTVEPYRELVIKLRKQKVEIAAIHQRLQERGFRGSYMAVYRFVRRMEPHKPEATVRVERPPGEEGQVDFGYAGKMLDEEGNLRKSWCFVMTLSWSRHQYVEFVFDQKVATWLSCHRHAFEFFGGVPQKVVIDNLKTAILKAVIDDPQVQQSYRECAEHYGFLIDPNRPGTPRHKGKVEKGGVHYVKRNFLGGREATTIPRANQDVRNWCLSVAGERDHGTTHEKPVRRFMDIEQGHLMPLPGAPFDMGIWKILKLHRDCHVVFEKAFYSAPFEYIGQKVRVRGGNQQVRIYTQDYQLIATHDRGAKPGTRMTHPDHLPPHLLPGLLINRESCVQEAVAIGDHTARIVHLLLEDRVVDRLATAGRLLRLAERYGPERLEAACRRAILFEDPAYMTVKRILRDNLDQQSITQEYVPGPPASAFVRNVLELVGTLGGVSWN